MKFFITTLFIIFVSSALVMHFTRKSTDIEATLLDTTKPKMKVKNLMVLSYDHKDLKSSTFVSLGSWMESGVFHAEKGVRSTKYNTELPTNLFAKKASITFLSENLDQLFSSPEYNDVILQEDISIDLHGMNFTGEVVYFDNTKQLLYSSKPVEIRGLGRWASSRDGFVYNINDEELTMTGKVEGAFDDP